ncbi:copper resistance protein CopC [Streptomyces rapamycinicus]|uniref:Protein YobA n=2 Tax=Streptomyces rapamycinicus TaxID=1226757 RepID=A0A0A0NQ92_STRRN|nr:copper resistance protein CopC [Streptomyces rapamycinicus]AGP56600.1 membrane protein [Streptomyces rapamycinicus NRRL 5491]MBB4784209.1 copper transport protein [Streptomyces rapamycinicus]RLV80308.1 membrane protein [Streptomyces rapamycinicus NRRL 5491]UTO64540.1 copper resistance protein CopC [Streptomyces rapamycinicus]UTP32496.1 copper resistance protein CopC [Streptomyces rapamycinicus NRRL 5491]
MPSPTSLAPAGPTATPTRTTATARRLMAICGTLLAALLCALSVGANSASAHAALTSTDPADGSVVKTAPREVTLNFSEGVLLSGDSVRVLDPKGKRVDTGKTAHVDGKSSTAAAGLHSGLPDGTYTVAWKAVSEDSHPVSGAFTFSIGAPSKTKAKVPTGEASDTTVSTLYGIGRYAAYGGFAALVGGCVFAGVCRSSRPVRKIAVGGWVTVFTASLLLLLLRGPYTDGEGIGGLLDLGRLGDVLSTKPGAALLSRLLLLGAAAVFLAVLFGSYTRRTGEGEADARRRQDLAFGLGFGGTVMTVGLAATWAMAEHASVGLQRQLAMPVDVIHLIAVGVWLGGLASLAVTLRAGEPIERAAVRRFSRLAFGSVVALVVTGLYQSWRQVGSWGALTDTEYGRWLLVKVGLVAVLVGIAAISRRWTGRLTDVTEAAGAEAEKDLAVEAESDAETDVETDAEATADTAKAGTKAAVKAARPVRTGAADAAVDTPAEAETEPGDGTGDDSGTGAAADDDPVRTAQLARQRAAKDRTATLRERDADRERSGLRRSVLAETIVAVVLLAVATVLSGTQPGRAETEQASAPAAKPGDQLNVDPVSVLIPYDTGPKSGRGKAVVMIDPALPGDNTLHVFTTDLADRPVDVPEVKLSLTLKGKGIGPLRIPLERLSTGHWSAKTVQLPMAGTWQLSLTVRTSDIDQVTETRNVKVAQ